MRITRWQLGATIAACALNAAHAQQQTSGESTQLPPVVVTAPALIGGYAATPDYYVQSADLGPLGTQSLRSTPMSVTVVPQDLMANQQLQTVNDTLRYLPSVMIRNQQGYEVSRPQARGFQSSIVQNTRLDGFNIIGTTAIPAENLEKIEVLNGLAGSLFGPQTPAGTFDYISKRPTDQTLLRFVEGYDSDSVFTEQLDAGGRIGPSGAIGYRFNLVHGEGQSWAPESNENRTLLSGAFDFHLDRQTVIETNFSHYSTDVTGLPGSFTYDSGKSTLLPSPVDPTRLGYGQPGAGTDLVTNTASVKLKHSFNDQWSGEIGVLYQNAERGLYGITNALTNNLGNYTVTKNFNAVPHFSILSNLAALNGHITLFGMKNDVTIGTNGFVNGQYSYRNSIATVLGSANLANPPIFNAPAVPANGGQYRSATLTEQSIVTGDTLHLNEQWAVQGVLSTSFIDQRSFNASGHTTSDDSRNGVLSPTVSLIYQPTRALTTYATYSNSVEEGEQAPAGTANVNQFMAPYRDREYEIGAKYALNDDFLVSVDGFWMTRPLANTNATTNVFSVVGKQRNVGAELFVQGNATSDLSLFGGITYIDARLQNTGLASTNDQLVVGVPRVKGDLAADYHPAFAHGFALTGAVHLETDRAATNTNSTFAPGYATFDLGMRYADSFWGHHDTFRFQVINLTNKAYYASVADGNIVGSPGANTAYLGIPRVFMASLELDY
ncbi:TonB-dependent receptor [Paraburkholderia fungorum]